MRTRPCHRASDPSRLPPPQSHGPGGSHPQRQRLLPRPPRTPTIAKFAEDIGLLPRYLFSNLIAECKEPGDSYDLLGGLFEAMNSPETPTGGRYKGVRYFNGGIFTKPARIEL